MFLALFSRFFLLLLMMILLSSILQFKKWFVFLEQWFFANKDSHVCFDFLTLKKNVGLGSFVFFLRFDFFLKYTSGFLTDFFSLIMGGTKPNWKKKMKIFLKGCIFMCDKN